MLRQSLRTPARALGSSIRSYTPAVSTPLRSRAAHAAPVLSRRIAPATSRWYSSEPEAAAKPSGGAEASPDVAADAASAVEGPEAELQKKLEAKEKEALDWKDKCLRSIADFRNLQDRTAREIKSARDFAISSFAKDLVESIDNLDRALSTVPADKLVTTTSTTSSSDPNAAAAEGSSPRSEDLQDLVNLHEGLKMTESILMSTLKKHGLERFDPMGEKFNPNEQEATFMAPQEGKEEGSVFFVQQKGFRLNGRILRAAKVGVVKNK